MNRCLHCYQELNDSSLDYHGSCVVKFFGTNEPPVLPFSEDDVEELAPTLIQESGVVTGAQRKLSIVGLWGSYILKPPTPTYPALPEIEDLTMHLAEIAGINVVPHSLIRMRTGSLAYLTKRVDRKGAYRVHMEDMCQLTERLTEFKYHGSHEQIAKVIMKHSDDKLLDVVNFAEATLFSFLVGNADLHLKNVSLLEKRPGIFAVSPYYDLVSTALVLQETEQLALQLNGKKSNFKQSDFSLAFKTFGLNDRQIQNVFTTLAGAYDAWMHMIESSFLSEQSKEGFQDLIRERMTLVDLIGDR